MGSVLASLVHSDKVHDYSGSDDLAVRCPFARRKARSHASAIGSVPVPSQFALALQPCDRHAQANDPARVAPVLIRRACRHRPARRARPRGGQSGHSRRPAVFPHARRTRPDHRRGRRCNSKSDDLPGFLLGRILCRRRISVRLHEMAKPSPSGGTRHLRISLREVPVDHAVLALALIKQEGGDEAKSIGPWQRLSSTAALRGCSLAGNRYHHHLGRPERLHRRNSVCALQIRYLQSGPLETAS